MTFTRFIALRYLFSKKRLGAINIISAISAGGVALATMAMVCVLAGFNGFRDLIEGLYTAIDPQLVVVPKGEKFVSASHPALERIRGHKDVPSATECLTEQGLILFKGHPLVVTLKGVADNYAQTTDIASIIYSASPNPEGFKLRAANLSYGTPGIGLASQFGAIDYGSLQICAPRQGERINLSNPIESFNVDDIISPGVCFQVHQRKYDDGMLIVPLQFVAQLYERPGQITSLELRLAPQAEENRVKSELQELAGKEFSVLNRMEQQEETFRIMSIEKIFAYAFLTFIALVACFNIIGSVSMLIIDKQNDAQTLRHLGATRAQIARIFLLEGWLIALGGALIGIVLGTILCLVQQHSGILKLGGSQGNFIVEAYPVSIHVLDLLAIFLTAAVAGLITVWYPVRYLARRLLS